jgi:hypothetical protein
VELLGLQEDQVDRLFANLMEVLVDEDTFGE